MRQTTMTASLGAPVVGSLSNLGSIIDRTRPDRIVIALADRRGRLPVRELVQARVQGVAVEDGAHFYERLSGKVAIESLTPHDLISSPDFRKSHLDLAFGHALSLCISLVALILLAPLLAAIAVAIKLDSPGPVFFVQNRVGLRGRTLRLLKFRTMRPADRPTSEWARDNGDRVTRVGKWLRRFRLDELPQFVNVLRGEMNLVGPRPHPVCNYDLFMQQIPYYWLRAAVRPGLTGWAQVRQGYANGLEEETEKMRYDLYYIKHMSARLDLRILAGTVWRVLAGGDTADRPAPAPALRVGPLLQGRLFRQEKTMRKRTAISTGFVLAALLVMPSHGAGALGITFGRGDVLVSLETGPVLWWLANGLPRGVLVPTVAGTGEGMAFDNSGNLYVTRWCNDTACGTGNTIERFSRLGLSLGPSGSGYNCNPHAIVFDSTGPSIGTAYVGQAGCRKSILKFVPGQPAPTEFMVAEDSLGVFWLDLAPDRCVLFYTSFGPNVKRFDACTSTQLADFNAAPLPGGIAQDLRVLPDGGVLVSSGQVIVRLDPAGVIAQTYEIPEKARSGPASIWWRTARSGPATTSRPTSIDSTSPPVRRSPASIPALQPTASSGFV